MNRALPWSLAAAAYVFPPTWAYFAIEQDVAAQKAAQGWACGNPALGMMLLACIASGLLSLTATGLRGFSVGWWKVELLALATPLIGAIGFVAYMFLQ
jgi:hypothetical protein